MTESPPLLELASARIDRSGVPLLEGLSVTCAGPRVALLGGWGPVFELFDTEASLSAGSASILGHAAESATADGIVGLARRNRTLPKSWTAKRYLEESALLLGMRRSDARDAVTATLAMLGLNPLAPRKIGALDPHEQRALGIAHARLGEPPVLALESPFTGLERNLEFVVELVERASAGRALLISFDETNPSGVERSLAEGASEVLIVEAGTLVGQGAPAQILGREAHRFLVTVSDHGQSFAEALAEKGHRLSVARPGGVFGPLGTEELSRGALRLVVEAPSTAPILDASLESAAPVVELRPLGTRPS